MLAIVNQADSLKESPASRSFVSHRTGTGNNENPIAKQESNEIRRRCDGWNRSGNRQITRSQPIRIGRDERPKPIARNVTGHHIGQRSRNRIVVTGWTIREIRDPVFLTHETHESNEIKAHLAGKAPALQISRLFVCLVGQPPDGSRNFGTNCGIPYHY